MRFRRTSNGNAVVLASAIATGGEARVYEVDGEASLLAKVYRRPTEMRASKLHAMVANPPSDPMAAQGHVSIAWPVDILETIDSARTTIGFLMPRAEGTRRAIDFYNPMSRRRECPLFDYRYLHRAARNLAAAVHAVHARGYVIGDVNESNILVTETALVTLVDTDSFQVRDPVTGIVYRCPVGKPDYTPPELQGARFSEIDRTPEHDRFGLAVLIFLMLMEGTHPFAGIFEGSGEPPLYAQRIACGAFPYRTDGAPVRPMPHAPPFETVHPDLRKLFLDCFETGHRDSSARPSAEAWVTALHAAESSLVVCPKNSQHRYGSHLAHCPWCERARAFAGRDPFPSRDAANHGDHLKPVAITQTALPSAAMPAPAVVPKPTPPVKAPSPPPPATPIQPAPRPLVSSTIPAAKRRQPPRKPGSLRWLVIGGIVALGLPVAWFAIAQSRDAAVRRHVTAAQNLLAESRALRQDPVDTADGRNSIKRRIEKAQAAKGEADSIHNEQLGKEALREIDIAHADQDALEAKSIVAGVVASIDKYKKQSLSDQDAERVRNELKSKCQDAVAHADKALGLDPDNHAAIIERVRAFRLTGDTDATERALSEALKHYPDDPELASLKSLIRAADGQLLRLGLTAARLGKYYDSRGKRYSRTLTLCAPTAAIAVVFSSDARRTLLIRWLERLLARWAIWRVDTSAPLVAITIDDGPDAVHTPAIINILNDAGVKATFFPNGNIALRRPNWMRYIASQGHDFGSHCMRHERISHFDFIGAYRHVTKSMAILQEYGGKPIRYVRPPYGRRTLALYLIVLLKRARLAMWTYDSDDHQDIPAEEIIRRMRERGIRPGDILLFHADGENTVQVLPDVIALLREKGLTPVTLSELEAAASARRTGTLAISAALVAALIDYSVQVDACTLIRM